MTQIKVLLIPVVGSAEVCEIDSESAQDLQKLVGGYVEIVTIPRAPGLILWVNEDPGRLEPPPEVNLRGSFLADQPLTGPVVVTGRDGVETASLPESLLNALMRRE